MLKNSLVTLELAIRSGIKIIAVNKTGILKAKAIKQIKIITANKVKNKLPVMFAVIPVIICPK